MLSYNTSLPIAPPQAMPAPDLQAPNARYGSTHADMMRAQMSSRNADYELEKSQAQSDYALKRQAAEQQLALSGLQQMAQAQQNANSLRNARIGNVSSLLSGLFT